MVGSHGIDKRSEGREGEGMGVWKNPNGSAIGGEWKMYGSLEAEKEAGRRQR